MRIGQKIIHLESVDSTNNYAANLAREGNLAPGTVILADEQYAGRGQRMAKWQSQPGMNLTFSYFLDDVNLSVEERFDLTKLVSVTLSGLLKKRGLTSRIKWPNDLYIRDEKIAGVLIETQLSGNRIRSCIIGVGLNVNQTGFEDLNATSLKLETGIHYTIREVLFLFIQSWNEVVDSYKTNSLHITDTYHQLLYHLDEKAQYADNEGEFEAVLTGVTPEGRLMLKREGGIVNYDLKEVRFLPGRSQSKDEFGE